MNEFNVTAITMADVPEWIGYITAVGTLLASIYYGIKKILKGAKAISTFIEEGKKTNLIVHRELQTNGGSSIRDAITRIDQRVVITEARSRILYSYLKIAFWEASSNGEIVHASVQLCTVTNRTPEDILGWNWIDIVHVDDRDRVVETWRESISQKRNFKLQFRFVTPDNIEVPVEAIAYAIRSAAHLIIQYVGVIKALNAVDDFESLS